MYMQYVTEYDVKNISDTRPRKKYDNNGKGWYFRFVDDNNMSYKYILSITWPEMGQLNTYNPIYFNDKGHREDHNRSNTTCLKSRLSLSDHISGR